MTQLQCLPRRFRRRAITVGLALLLAGGSVGPATASPGAGSSLPQEAVSPLVDDSSLLLRFAPGLDAAGIRAIADRYGNGHLEPIAGTGFSVLHTDPGAAGRVRQDLAGDGRVAAAEWNHIQEPASVPTDPMYGQGQAWYFEALRIPQAWDVATGGDDMVLAIVDSGVDSNHPDLVGRLLPGRDVLNDDDTPSDTFGHGTEVATVAAAAVDGQGLAGVARRGKILPVKVAGADGKSTDAYIAEGIVWAADHGADVINISMGGPSSPAVVREAVNHARARGALIIAAAGNQSTGQVSFPAAFDGVLAVGSVDRHDRLADFSNFGSALDIVAPGVDILVGTLDRRHELRQGTSFSTPIVAAVALATRATFPGETAEQIAERLVGGARDVGPLGFDEYHGAGVVDALGPLGYQPGRSGGLEDPPDNTAGQARPLALPPGPGATGRTAGALSVQEDVDWYTFELDQARWLTWSPRWDTGNWRLHTDFQLEIFDGDLRGLHTVNGEAWLPAGRYLMRLRASSGSRILGGYVMETMFGRSPGRASLRNTDSFTYDGPVLSVATADFSGDGLDDLLVSTGGAGADPVGGGLVVLPADSGPGLFRTPLRYQSGPDGERSLAVGDIDGNGRADAVLAVAAGLEVHYQAASGGLGAPPRLVPLPGAASVEIGDVDGDGRLDLAAASPAGVVVARQEPDGHFTTNRISAATTDELELADIDGDGNEEIVALECGPVCSAVTVHDVAPGGTTTTTAALSTGRSDCVLGIGDVTGDRRVDAFVGCESTVTFLLGQPGGLSPVADFDAQAGVDSLDARDIDGNGVAEIIFGAGRMNGFGILWPEYDPVEGGAWYAHHYLADDLTPENPEPFTAKGLTFGDFDGNGAVDVAGASGPAGAQWLLQDATPPKPGAATWVRDVTPVDGAAGAAPDVHPTVHLARRVPTEPEAAAPVAKLIDGANGAVLASAVRYDPATNAVVIRPSAPLIPGRAYSIALLLVKDAEGNTMPTTECCYRFVVGQLPAAEAPPPAPDGGQNPPPTDTPVRPAQNRSGYWMLDGDGTIYAFGDAAVLGHGTTGTVDVEPTPTGKGYWILNRNGGVSDFGDATALGSVDTARLAGGEVPASLSATPTGAGYWVFTNQGRAIAFGDASHLGDMSAVKLNGPVLGSVATPSGKGYYMVASDGGIFAFGDAAFAGSMGGKKLNAPVQSLVPDADGNGYWLVASDGGIFAFDAPFRGSMGGAKLNKPVVGMVRYGDGYLMVGADGGIFNFSTSPFAGSLGDKPPASPVVAVATLP